MSDKNNIDNTVIDFMKLSNAERRAFEKLSQVELKGIWALGVSNVIENFSVLRFRRLISELKNQAKENPSVMKNILGDAYESVMSL